MSRDEFHDLGMDRKIPRRDFLNGVAIAVGGTWAGGLGASGGARTGETSLAPALKVGQTAASEYYPPALTGLRGNHAGSVDLFPRIREGAYAQGPITVDAGEEYDLVIVGAGISGLSAAYFWRRALGANQRILILDNHDDFGGHAKRNEFRYQGRTLISYGGTMGRTHTATRRSRWCWTLASRSNATVNS